MFGMFRVILLVSLVYAKHEIYEAHILYEVAVKHAGQARLVNELEDLLHLDAWSHALPGHPGLVMVAQDLSETLQDALDAAGIQYEVKAKNVKELLDVEDQKVSEALTKSTNRTNSGGLAFDKIYTYYEVDVYLEGIAAAYPNIVTLVNAGLSFELRPIKYLKISTTNFQDQSKPIVYMQSLLHAREWITQPATLYAIEKLVKDAAEQDTLTSVDWVILPIANPDGFEYARENRLWRKNRATGYMIGNLCSGVDLNRNFDFEWSEHSSNLVCSENFHGRGPFSEPETAAIRDIVLEHSDRLSLFLDIHSFGSYILYGYGSGQLPSNGLILHLVGIQMATKIDKAKMSWNPNYVVGNTAMILYKASGTAQDYAQAMGSNLSYTYELPGHRYGLGTGIGFLVDPDFIEQAGFETWEGIKAGARYVSDNFVAKGSAQLHSKFGTEHKQKT